MERPENPTERWLAMSELRRHILSAQVTHALNKQLNRHSPDNVRKVAGMKVPSERDLARAQYGPELPRLVALKLLHRDILWAQVRVALNEQLGHTTSGPVLRLAKMKLPDRAEFDRARAYDEANSPKKGVVEPSTHLIHPGVILLEEFIEPLGLAPEQVAQELGLNPAQFTSITQGVQDITPEVATLLAQRFDLSERFWTNLQSTYDRALMVDH
ncbi:HigA family addiction module antitoxin [Nesterenkonia sp. Act20]|uniref:HigA family addiction module antitoxin n=1 Tax=Nesterenkonia sp. Act20 TaxID=1483432 RepID=UPI001C48AD63|nr:HigA family addiction module antitoxin [Nesterenkonia sp. Act20]